MILCRALSYEENTLDKSLLKNLLSASTQRITDFKTPSFLWMTGILELVSQDPHLWN